MNTNMGMLSNWKNLAIVKGNLPKIEAIKKEKDTKINRLAIYMLGGRPVTGATMIAKFNIYSYRDAIYDLGKKGYNIASKIVTEANGVQHRIWWLSDFDEEFVLGREEKLF